MAGLFRQVKLPEMLADDSPASTMALRHLVGMNSVGVPGGSFRLPSSHFQRLDGLQDRQCDFGPGKGQRCQHLWY